MNEDQRLKIESVQYLRAVAALGVLLAHATTSLTGKGWAMLALGNGVYGVDLFFVISGFIMFFTTVDRKITAVSFFIRRCIRIFPAYFILTTFGLMLARFLPGHVNNLSSNVSDYIKSLLFIPYYNSLLKKICPLIQQGWTLNYEMFFYTVFAIALCFSWRRRLIICGFIFMFLTTMRTQLRFSGPLFQTYTDLLFFEFIFGMLIAVIFTKYSRALMPLFFIFLGATVLAVVGSHWLVGLQHRAIYAGLPASAIICGGLLLEKNGLIPHSLFFLLIGDASYSIYLIHTFTLSVLKRIFIYRTDLSSFPSHVLFILCALTISLLISIAFYSFVERPITIQLRSFAKRLNLL